MRHMTTRNLKIEYMPPLALQPSATNARVHDAPQIAQIIASIAEFGFTNPVLVDEADGIIAGHGRVTAAINMDLDQVPTIRLVGLSKAQRRAYVLADNKIALNGSWDYELLSVELQSLEELKFDLRLTGFHEKEIAKHQLGVDGQTHEDDTPKLPKRPKSRTGKIIKLGQHRIMCGDATAGDDVKKLLSRQRIAVAITSPPYASQRKYDESSGFEPIPPDEYSNWFALAQHHIAAKLADDGSFFLNIKEHCDDGQRLLYVKDLTIAFVREWGWRLVDEYAWTHGGTPKGITRRFKNGWEPIFHFTKSEHKFRPDSVMHETDAAVDWGGGHPADQDGMAELFNKAEARDEVNAKGHVVKGFAYPSNVLRIGKNTMAAEHGAMFPVKLPEFFIRAYSDKGDVIFDPFIGAGTTLIAAEKHGRRCFGMDISPAYCDVAVERWENFTGEKAKR